MQNFSKFQEKQILNTLPKNMFADRIMTVIGQYCGFDNPNDVIIISGSVAKNMQGFDEKDPKDLDLITRDKKVFDFCSKNMAKLFPYYLVKNIGNNRVYIDNGHFSIEIWLDLHFDTITVNDLKIKKYAK